MAAKWKAKFFFLLIFCILSPYSAEARAGKKSPILLLNDLQGQIYSLTSGPENRCPEKMGFIVRPIQREAFIYPMRSGWEKVRQTVNPLLTMKAIRQSWEPAIQSTHQSGKTENIYSTEIAGNSIKSKVRMFIDGHGALESHATLIFRGDTLLLTRWSESDGVPLLESVSCKYKHAPVLKTASAH